MSLLGIFVLTTTVSVSRAPTSNTSQAVNALSKASYKQFGIDKRVEHLEKEYIPKNIRKHGQWIVLGVKMINEKKISYEWRF